MGETRLRHRAVPAAAAAAAAALVDPPVRIDQVLSRAATVHPDRIAIRSGAQATTYAELDEAVTRAAAVIRELAGGERTVVAVSSILEADYVIAYYGAIRSGNIALPVNPLLLEPQLLHLLNTARATVLCLSVAAHERVSRIMPGLLCPPRLTLIGADAIGGATPTLAQRLAGSSAGRVGSGADPEDPGEVDPDEIAALHFTSGTTGPPKAVLLSHRNVTVNARQVADAHALDPTSVSLVCFPTYHPMHLNSAVHAAATQVLRADPDLTAAVELANRNRATHFYSLPAWLIRLAGQADSVDLTLRTVRFVASGGSALPAAAAAKLRDRLGVPVVQGYGLAETAPLTHFDDPHAPTPGAVGRALADTECRVVDLASRVPVAARELGEIQLRGPQLMQGYLNQPEPAEIDEQGWFSTGDVGYQDAAGLLFLVDRLKDVYKHDNWLVSPSEIESVLAAHPAVEDCVVLDRPDETHGSVAHAYVVAPGLAGQPPRLAEILDWANQRLPSYKQVQHAELVPNIPRTPNGKVPRRELRGALHAELAGGSKMVVLINKFTLTASPERFEEVFAASSEFMRSQPGFIDHTLVKSLRSPNVYVNIAHWEDAASHFAVIQSSGFQQHIRELAEVARAEPDLYAAVLDVTKVDR
jgi:long-chain acyl-CoA synthetase